MPRKRKVVLNPQEEEVPPEKDFVKPLIQRKEVITGFNVGERQPIDKNKRQRISELIKHQFPQVTGDQLSCLIGLVKHLMQNLEIEPGQGKAWTARH